LSYRANYSAKVDFDCFKESGLIEYTADVLLGLQLTVLDELELTDKNKSKNKDKIAEAKEEMPRKITAVIIKQRNAQSWAKQDFLFFSKNNCFQEV
jgi:replicative DNA helicase